jgi:hypothetical protein
VKVNIIRRREFIAGSALVGAGFARVMRGEALPDQDKRDRMAVMTLSFNSVLKHPDHPDDPARTLDILDAPQMIADRYGIHHVEFQHTHFASIDAPYFKEIRVRLKKAKSQMNQICLEFETHVIKNIVGNFVVFFVGIVQCIFAECSTRADWHDGQNK